MAIPGLAPSSLDWRLQAGIGVLTVAVAVLLLVRYRARPFIFALGVWLLEVGLLIVGRGLTRTFVNPGHVAWLQSHVVIFLPAAGGVAVLTWRGWWKAAGFTPPSEWRQLRILWLVGLWLILPALSLSRGVHVRATTIIPLTGYVVLPTATEELFHRGIILRATIGYGAIPAALISAIFFGLSHVNNFFASSQLNPYAVLEQIWLATLIGVFLAAVRLRMNAIWVTMAAHATWDLLPLLVYGLYSLTHRPTVGGFWFATGYAAFFAAIGLLLLRRARPSIIPTELKS
jgi:membrane protease YdiL (CAAX protease family)